MGVAVGGAPEKLLIHDINKTADETAAARQEVATHHDVTQVKLDFICRTSIFRKVLEFSK